MNEEGSNSEEERNLGLRNGEVPASATGARLGVPRIHMEFRTELHVVALAAEIAKQRFPASYMSACVAVPHGVACCDSGRSPRFS